MSTPVRYRRAGPDDVAAVAAQGRTAFLETFGTVYEPDDIAAYFATAYGSDATDIANDAAALFLAEDDAGLVGHLKLGALALPVGSGEAGDAAREIKRLYVLGRAHGKGVGRTLLDLGVIQARGAGARALYLSCWTGNERALRFYRRGGFAIAGRTSFAVGRRIDEDHILRLAL